VDIGAEVMTFVPDRPCAPFRDLEKTFAASDTWWSDLRTSLDLVAAHPCGRDLTPMNNGYQQLVAESFGQAPPDGLQWTTQHADLHWGHLTVPSLYILDWERWGTTIHGLGPATLYCFSLLVPDVAAKVREVFADVLDSPSGRYAQLCVIADRIGYHDPGYDDPLGTRLRRLAHQILNS
jgi:hypothetical protein